MTLDVQTFAALAAQAEPAAWAQAVDLYRAPLLDGIYVDNAPALESHLLRAQEQWQQQAINLFNRLITHHLERSAYTTSLALCPRLVALEPWREETQRQVMLLLTARSDKIGPPLPSMKDATTRCRRN